MSTGQASYGNSGDTGTMDPQAGEASSGQASTSDAQASDSGLFRGSDDDMGSSSPTPASATPDDGSQDFASDGQGALTSDPTTGDAPDDIASAQRQDRSSDIDRNTM